MKNCATKIMATAMAGTLLLALPAVGLGSPDVANADEVATTTTATDAITIADGIYQVKAVMADPSNLGMVRIADNSAYLIAKDGQTSLRFKMGGTGIDYLYPSSSGAAAKAAGQSAWIGHTAITEKVGEKYWFTVPVTISATGETVVPLSAHSARQDRWYSNKDVTVTYTGSETDRTSKLTPAKMKLSKVKAGKKKATVSWSKAYANATQYQVRYSLKKSFKGAKTAKASAYGEDSMGDILAKKSITVKKLKKGKKYYFQARAYNWVTGTYGSWSATKSVKVK